MVRMMIALVVEVVEFPMLTQPDLRMEPILIVRCSSRSEGVWAWLVDTTSVIISMMDYSVCSA